MIISKAINLTILDVETTGLNMYLDRIIEFAYMQIKLDKDFQITYLDEKPRSMQFNPTIPISKRSSEVNKYTDESVKDFPKFKELADQVYQAINNTTIVAHNANFDVSFLKKELRACGYNLKQYYQLDTYAFFRSYSAQLKSYKLSNIAETFGMQVEASSLHKATYDVEILGGLVKKLITDVSFRIALLKANYN